MNSYDLVPYKSHPFRQTHPDRLAVIGTLMGASPPPIETARVLELGCASGGNLIPMADQLPGATFLGIDYSARQVSAGVSLIEAAGLRNVELRHIDILDFEAEPEAFDYILCHGVYSWVPDEVQRRILEICGKCLSPRGIAYVSYNTYPGWHMRGMIRDIMRYRAKFFDAPPQKLAQARGLLTFLSESVRTENNPYGLLLKNELESIGGADDSYLFHEHLEEVNAPTYFHEFAERAGTVGLRYLGEADFGAMSLNNFPDHVKAMLRSVSRDVIETEQYMDFLRNRMFRQTLLCRDSVEIDAEPQPQRLLNLEVATNSRPEGEVSLSTDARVTFRRGPSVLTTTDPVVKAAMLHLREQWPRSVPFLELAAIARSRLGGPLVAVQTDSMSPGTLQLAETLVRCYATGQIDLRASRPKYTSVVSERPRVSNLARVQAALGSRIADRQHGSVHPDDLERQMLMLLDGTRNAAELTAALVAKVLDSTLLLHRDGRRIESAETARELVQSAIPAGLRSLAGQCLLIE